MIYGTNTERNLNRYLPDWAGDVNYIRNLKISVIRYGQASPVATQTIASPQYTTTDGIYFTFNISSTIFDDIPVIVASSSNSSLISPEYYLDISFDVYPICSIRNISRANNYSFNGSATTTGSIVIVNNRKIGEDVVDTSLSQMIIGTNGMVFNQSNSKYFYAGEDGIEIKWDDAKIVLDDDRGFAVIPGVSSKPWGGSDGTLNIQDTIVVMNHTGIEYLHTLLPDATTYGEGRRLTIVGALGLCARDNQVIRIDLAHQSIFNGGITRSYFDCKYLDFGTSWSQWTETNDNPGIHIKGLWGPELELMPYNGNWYVIGGLLPSPITISVS